MNENERKSVFETLNGVNVNDHTEKKNGLTYLSWAWAWAEVKKKYPDATYTIYENAQGWNYHTDGRTCWVKTGVTIEGIEHIEYLPVMDYKNASIPVDRVTSFDVNKAIQRSLTKAAARHGLGLYIYASEDVPEAPDGETVQDAPKDTAARKKPTAQEAAIKIPSDLMEQAAALDIDIEKVAIYLKKPAEQITIAEMQSCIDRKRAALAIRAAAQATEGVPENVGV